MPSSPTGPEIHTGSVLGFPYKEVFQVAPSIPPAFIVFVQTLCLCPEGYSVRGPVLCHPEGKVHITQTGSKGPAQEKNVKTTSKENRQLGEEGRGEGIIKIPAVPRHQGPREGPGRSFGREHWGGSDQESPAPPQPEASSPISPTPITARTKGL